MKTVALLLVLLACATGASEAGVVGQVACSQCWHEADRSTVPYGDAGDLACAAECAEAGVAPSIAVREEDGTFRLLLLEGDPPAPHTAWLDLMGWFVEAETTPAGEDRVRVTSLAVSTESPWPAAEAASVPDPHELSWLDVTGQRQDLDAFHHRITVVNFWATWCKPCIKEMPILVKIQRDYGLLGVQVVGIAADAADARNDVLAFARDVGVTFPVWLGATTTDMAALGVGPALPATVVLDREGKVAHRTQGVVESHGLRDVLDDLLEAPRVAHAAPKKERGHTHAPGSLVPS